MICFYAIQLSRDGLFTLAFALYYHIHLRERSQIMLVQKPFGVSNVWPFCGLRDDLS